MVSRSHRTSTPLAPPGTAAAARARVLRSIGKRGALVAAEPELVVTLGEGGACEAVAKSAGHEYTRKHTMSTSVHIPKPLLEAVDRRARALKISRNRLIVNALEREVAGRSGWSEGFFERLGEVDEATGLAAAEMLATIRASRRSKEPRQL